MRKWRLKFTREVEDEGQGGLWLKYTRRLEKLVAEILGEREEQVESKLHEERGCTKSYVEVELHMELEAEHWDEKKQLETELHARKMEEVESE